MRAARPGGLAVAVQTRPHDTQDGDEEQDGAGHIAADEGDGEDGGHDGKGGRGGIGQRGESSLFLFQSARVRGGALCAV